MNNIIERIKNSNNLVPLVILFVFFVVNCIIFWKHGIMLMVDVGRELTVPQAILDGKVLYKDILNIYGPLAFLINAGAYKLFGVKIAVLNYMGAFAGFVFLFSCYFLSREFVGRLLSLSISLLICVFMFNSTLYNFLMPYSYNTVYGLSAYAFSGLFLVKYIKAGGGRNYLLASLAAGFCISNKIEFYWLPLILAISFLFMRPLNLKDLFKAFVAFMVFPISSLLILCIQGLNYNDILPALNVIKASATAPSMIWFHKFIGLYPSKRMLLQGINPSLILILVFVISYLGFKYTEQRKNLRIILTLIILGIVLWNMYFLPRLFCFLPMIFVVLFLINIKEIFKDKALLVLCLLCAGASLKTFFFSDLMVYGFYTVPLLVLGLSLMFIKAFRLPKFLNAGFKLKEHYAIYILMLFVVIFYISHLNIRIQIGNDKLYGLNDNMTGLKGFNKPVNEMVTYLKDNTNINDRVVVYPEGEIINFLSGRKPDYMYYSLHSIFIDTFGKENIIERFKKERFEYVIIVKGFSMPYFGTETSYDELNNFVENNYKLVYVTQSSRKTDGLYLYKLNM